MCERDWYYRQVNEYSSSLEKRLVYLVKTKLLLLECLGDKFVLSEYGSVNLINIADK